MAFIEMRAVKRTLRDERRQFVVDVPEFDLRSGDRKAIIGRTGSGKTTALDLFALASSPDSAERFALTDSGAQLWPDVTALGADALGRLRAKNFGYVLQNCPLFPFLTYMENAELGQRIAGRLDRPYLLHLLRDLELDLPPDTHIAHLSVGQRQRLAIARALAHRPVFVMCDEPTAALDPHTSGVLMQLLLRLSQSAACAVLLVTHDRALAAAHDCQIYEMVPRTDNLAGSVLVPAGAPA